MKPHYAARIRYQGSTAYEYHCACGYVAKTLRDYDAHVADAVAVTHQ